MLINLRNALMAGKRTPTARDYVQDGFVAMWDGIENAGWGVHDASATTWKDLIGNVNLSVVGNTVWGDNCLITNGGGAEYNSVIDYSTIEACVLRESGNGLFIDGGWRAIVFTDTVVRFSSRARRRVAVPIAGRPSTFAATGSGGTYFANDTAYRDGVASSMLNNSNWANLNTLHIGNYGTTGVSVFVGKIFCIRLYSRALTEEEIAHNYKIDKARFNLP